MRCPICQSNHIRIAFDAQVRKKHLTNFLECENCEFLFVPDPHWLTEAYAEPINATDVGLVSRNLKLAHRLTSLLWSVHRGRGRVLDYGGGNGLLTRLLRDEGIDCYWSDRYCANIYALGFEHDSNTDKNYVAATAMEVLEHTSDPIRFLSELLTSTMQLIVVSTELRVPKVNGRDWWYLGLDHGQHISFFSKKTLQLAAMQLGLQVQSSGGLHIFSRRPLSMLGQIAATRRGSALILPLARMSLTSKLNSDFALLKASQKIK